MTVKEEKKESRFLDLKKKIGQTVVTNYFNPFNPSTQVAESGGTLICEASLDFRTSSRTASSTYRDPVSKLKKQTKRRKQKGTHLSDITYRKSVEEAWNVPLESNKYLFPRRLSYLPQPSSFPLHSPSHNSSLHHSLTYLTCV